MGDFLSTAAMLNPITAIPMAVGKAIGIGGGGQGPAASLSNALGTNNQFQVGSPYNTNVLQSELNNQAQIYGNQQALAAQLQNQAAGLGPNPSQSLYRQNVDQNIKNAQGLISSQRGLNPALAARLGSNVASEANQQAASQAALMGQLQQLQAQQNLGNLYGQMQQGNIAQQGEFNRANLGAQDINAAVARGNQQMAGNVFGGLLGGVGSAIAALANGGQVKKMADGGEINDGDVTDYTSMTNPQSANSPKSRLGKSLVNSGSVMAAKGGKIPLNFKPGGKVPGKANVSGDSFSNDIVPAKLSPGEIVIPRSIATSADAAEKSKKFVQAVLARHGMRGKK